MGKVLIFVGLILLVAGLYIHFNPKAPFFGSLPGDFKWEGKNMKVYFPLASSILISVILSLILYLLNRANR